MPMNKVSQAAVAATLFGGILFNPPMIRVFDQGTLGNGIPVLFVYVFGAWLALIVVLMWIMRRLGDGDRSRSGDRRDG
ncbi:MAG: hypothetical protein ACFB3T_00505 [Geminicoccaceae bacterium]